MRNALWGLVKVVIVAAIPCSACDAEHDCNETRSCTNAAASQDGSGIGDQAVRTDAAGNTEAGSNDAGDGRLFDLD